MHFEQEVGRPTQISQRKKCHTAVVSIRVSWTKLLRNSLVGRSCQVELRFCLVFGVSRCVFLIGLFSLVSASL